MQVAHGAVAAHALFSLQQDAVMQASHAALPVVSESAQAFFFSKTQYPAPSPKKIGAGRGC